MQYYFVKQKRKIQFKTFLKVWSGRKKYEYFMEINDLCTYLFLFICRITIVQCIN